MRAVLLGLLGVAVICGFTFFNDLVLRQTYLISTHMPVSVYGGLILFLLIFNPLIFRYIRKLTFTARELTVILVMVLAAACVPSLSLMRYFPSAVMMPHWYEKTLPGWKENEVTRQLPPQMLADISRDEDRVLNGFVQGLGIGSEHIKVRAVPWHAWVRTLAFWLPLVVTLWIGLVALSLVVHRQWSVHEHLPYPIAKFTDALLPGPGKALGSIFTTRLFWIGAGSVLFIHLMNYGFRWFPEYLISIPTYFNLRSLAPLFPTFAKGGGGRLLFFNFKFTPLAFAYFLSTDVSFSLGIGPFLWALVVGAFTSYGITVEGGGLLSLPDICSFLNFGAYCGFLVAILYGGYHYYFHVLRQALCLPSEEKIEPQYVWSTRVFLACLAAMVGYITLAGVHWQLAIIYTLGVVLSFLIMGRIIAETGLFFIQTNYFPCAILWGLFGAKALGLPQMALLFMLSTILVVDLREAVMPFMVNSFKLVELNRLKLGRIAVWCGVAILFGLAIAVPVTLYFHYDRGANILDDWSKFYVPRMAFTKAVIIKERLTAQGNLEFSNALSGWQHFRYMKPDPKLVVAFAASFLLVLLFTSARLRFPKWPLHPLLFLVWNTYSVSVFCASFLGGWLIKILVVKYGGEKIYRRLKPLMFGLVAGEMLAGVIVILIGLLYYFITGDNPRPFNVI